MVTEPARLSTPRAVAVRRRLPILPSDRRWSRRNTNLLRSASSLGDRLRVADLDVGGSALPSSWRSSGDQQQVLPALHERGPGRVQVVRYEDVVVRPDEVRRQLARLLGAESERTVAADEVVLSWEWWKQRANRPVEADRAERWRSVLPPGTADVVVAVAGPTMKRFGYAPGQPPTAARLRAVVCVPRDVTSGGPDGHTSRRST